MAPLPLTGPASLVFVFPPCETPAILTPETFDVLFQTPAGLRPGGLAVLQGHALVQADTGLTPRAYQLEIALGLAGLPPADLNLSLETIRAALFAGLLCLNPDLTPLKLDPAARSLHLAMGLFVAAEPLLALQQRMEALRVATQQRQWYCNVARFLYRDLRGVQQTGDYLLAPPLTSTEFWTVPKNLCRPWEALATAPSAEAGPDAPEPLPAL